MLFRGDVGREGGALRRTADPLLLLPAPVRSVALLGALPGWREALDALGVEVLTVAPADGTTAEAVVTDDAAVLRACTTTSTALVTRRVPTRQLRAQHLHRDLIVSRPGPVGPRLFVPVRSRPVAQYAIRRRSNQRSFLRRFRSQAASTLVSLGVTPPSSTISVVSPDGSAPFFVTAARAVVPADGDWFVWLGEGDDLQRVVFHLFRAGASDPAWVLKASRVPGNCTSLDADERGLSLAAANSAAAVHAPTFLGRVRVGDYHGAVETAATGMSVHDALIGRGPVEDKLNLIEEIADWLLAVALEDAFAGGTAEVECHRLAAEVLPEWHVHNDVLQALSQLPAVLQHNDLGPWNLLAGPPFIVVDWESASRGLPLWDLVYFLGYALLLVAGDVTAERFLALFAGEHPLSHVLFATVRAHADVLKIPPHAVGPVVATAWMHHGLSHRHRRAALEEVSGASAEHHAGLEPLVQMWLSHPNLGPRWVAYGVAP